MVFKSYFDGGNQADSTQYDVVSLASVSGTPDQLKLFDHDWRAVLKKHRAPFLHTTDAVCLKKEPFTEENGWDEEKRDAFILDCVSVIENHVAVQAKRHGLIPHVLTVVLEDFNKARTDNPEVPRNANELIATQAVFRVLQQGSVIGADFSHLTFDQGEPFMGHILDRRSNKKARTHLKPINDRITRITGADMRDVPALQAADLFAWCVSHKRIKPRFTWQRRLLSRRNQFDDWVEYDQLMRVLPGVADLVESWNLPKRRPTR